MEILLETTNEVSDIKTLAALCLVNRTLNHFATPALYDKGIDFIIEIPDRYENPISWAIERNKVAVVEAFLRSGLSADARVPDCCHAGDDPEGGHHTTSLLELSVFSKEAHEYSDTTITEKLLDCGVNPNRANQEGNTPLIWCVQAAYENPSSLVPWIDLLLEWGADIDDDGELGHTVLHWAAILPVSHLIPRLLERGASRDETSMGGWTALAVASHLNHSIAEAWLRGAGAVDAGQFLLCICLVALFRDEYMLCRAMRMSNERASKERREELHEKRHAEAALLRIQDAN
jgi:hypothetical protein